MMNIFCILVTSLGMMKMICFIMYVKMMTVLINDVCRFQVMLTDMQYIMTLKPLGEMLYFSESAKILQ